MDDDLRLLFHNFSTKGILFSIAYALSALEFGLVFSFGALLSAMLETFDTNRVTAALVQSLLIGVSTCFSKFMFSFM